MVKFLLKSFLYITVILLCCQQQMKASFHVNGVVKETLSSNEGNLDIIESTDQGQYVAKYYPSPATNYIIFEFTKKVENNSRLIIYSFTGRKMTEVQISNLKITVNLSEYFRGIYMFQLISPKGAVEESGKFQVLK